MNDLLIYLLLVAAVAIGWLLGRRGSGEVVPFRQRDRQYYQGLNYLLDGRSEASMDSFINSLEVSSDTLETHIALGNLLRRKGEVERAIQVHQNLLGGDRLPNYQLHQAHLELARDYISAGLLDRAEQLLLDLCEESPTQYGASLRYLVEIYQSERDWCRAIAVATKLATLEVSAEPPPGGQSAATLLPHFYCEQARELLAADKLDDAREVLDETLGLFPACVRASLMLGDLEVQAGRPAEAIGALRRVREQDPDYLPETFALLRHCHEEIKDESAFMEWLTESLESHPSAALVLAVAEAMQRSLGDARAGAFLADQLAERPSFRGLEQLIDLQMGITEGKARDDLGLLQLLVRRLVAERPAYRCEHCGFSGQGLHWRCPGCQFWGTIRNINGAAPVGAAPCPGAGSMRPGPAS
jgi:lipopolysaccharide biosynthesis regulator YciM